MQNEKLSVRICRGHSVCPADDTHFKWADVVHRSSLPKNGRLLFTMRAKNVHSAQENSRRFMKKYNCFSRCIVINFPK